MQKLVSLQKKFNNVIDPFINKLIKASRYFENDESLVDKNYHEHEASVGTPIEANNCEEPAFEKCKTSKHAETKESVKEHYGEVIMKWVENHFCELGCKLDVKTKEIKQRQQILDDTMTCELSNLNSKMYLILSMLTRSSSKVDV